MRRLLVVAALLLAPTASAVALLESAPGRALVQVEGNATLHADGEARFAPAGAPLGAWRKADGVPLGPGACERGLCGLVVVEVRRGEALVLEGTSGVLVRPAPEATWRPEAPAPVPVPEEARATPAGAAAALVALLVAARRR